MTYLIDLFCGGGGTSTGASNVNNLEIIYCVNHDPLAIKSHAANHPNCVHAIEDIRKLNLSELKGIIKNIRKNDDKALIILWASLECTNHSKAKGGLPRDADSRTLAYDLYRYLEHLDIDLVWIENVREFMLWGGLDENLLPINDSSEYNKWIDGMKSFGYSYEYRILNSADYGAYTSRSRYFAQFAKENIKISWAKPTHSKNLEKGLKPYKAVKEVLQLDNHGESIFKPGRIKSEKTFERIYRGLLKYVAEKSEEQFLTAYYSTGNNTHSINNPNPTVPTKDRFSLISCTPLLLNYNSSTSPVIKTDRPSPTITTVRTHYLINPQYSNVPASIDKPCFTLIAKMDKRPPSLACAIEGKCKVKINDNDKEIMKKIKYFMIYYLIEDIKMRMLEVEELLQIQGFPANYILHGTIADKKKFIGNAVEVTIATALLTETVYINYEYLKIAS